MVIRILSHNAYWFQGHPFAGDQPGAPEAKILAECAAWYARIGAQVVCLQEIQSMAAAAAIALAARQPFLYRAGETLTQYGGACLGAGLEAAPDETPVGAVRVQRVWQRVLLAQGGKMLQIANIHAPSDRQLGTVGAAQRLAEFAAFLKVTPLPDVLCGDFNERPGRPVAQLLAAAGYVDCAERTQNGDRSTSIGGKRGDYIWVLARLADRVKQYDVVKPHQFLSAVKGKAFTSDHLPLWVDLDL